MVTSHRFSFSICMGHLPTNYQKLVDLPSILWHYSCNLLVVINFNYEINY